MKKKVTASAVAVILIASVVGLSFRNKTEPKPTDGKQDENLIKRGEYLVNVIGCDDCHSPKKMGPNGPEPDMDRRFSGHPANMPVSKVDQEQLKSWLLFNQTLTAFVGPWGVSFAANITSDQTGIGSWTEQQFFKAMREGKYKGLDNTRPLLPPMPWFNFRKATDDDLRAIFAYLKSTKPVANVAPSAIPPNALGSLK
jgi:hypothetical protein